MTSYRYPPPTALPHARRERDEDPARPGGLRAQLKGVEGIDAQVQMTTPKGGAMVEDGRFFHADGPETGRLTAADTAETRAEDAAANVDGAVFKRGQRGEATPQNAAPEHGGPPVTVAPPAKEAAESPAKEGGPNPKSWMVSPADLKFGVAVYALLAKLDSEALNVVDLAASGSARVTAATDSIARVLDGLESVLEGSRGAVASGSARDIHFRTLNARLRQTKAAVDGYLTETIDYLQSPPKAPPSDAPSEGARTIARANVAAARKRLAKLSLGLKPQL